MNDRLRERWLAAGPGRLGGDPRPAREPSMFDEAHFPARVCWRCGADGWKGAPLSGCTEKRGDGPPWRHEYMSPVRDDPWKELPLHEVLSLAQYLALKADGSFAATVAWSRVAERDQWVNHAIALYMEKAEKRSRLLGWVLTTYERRYARGERPLRVLENDDVEDPR